MVSIRQAVAASFLSRYTTNVINIVAIMVISRLLTPEEIGVFSICAVIIGLASLLRNAGAGEYLIQERELTRERLRNVFSVLLVSSWVLALAILLLRGTAADFYRQPGIADVLLIQVIGFVVTPFGAPAFTMMRRNMEFRTLAIINITSAFAHSGVSVALAWAGYGYYGLAWGGVAGMVMSVVMTVILRWNTIERMPSFRGARKILSISLAFQGAEIVRYFNQYISEMILGRFLGMAAVATFNRAASVQQLFQRVIMQGLMPVAMPAFAEHLRQGENVRVLFLKGQSILQAVSWTFFVIMFFIAEPFVLLMFGSQWGEVIPIVRILCVAGFISGTTSLAPEVLKAVGAAKPMLKAEILLAVVRIGMIVPAATHSLHTLAWTLALANVLRGIVMVIMLNRIIDLPYHQWINHGWRGLAISAVAMVPAAIAYYSGWVDVPENMPFLTLLAIVAAVGAVCGIFWIAAIYLFGHRLRDEINRIFGTIGGFLSRRRDSAQ